MSHSQPSNKTFFGHPIQLATLFHIELWERFSFSGLQGILMLYLYYELSKGGLGIDKTVAGGIVARMAAACICPPSLARGSPTACWAQKKRCLFRALW